jgi:prepilin-type N-terminal cleavage/methylation domain-containing protein
MKTSKSGFTLVEILIVLIVISILAALVIVSYGNVQAKARDTRRMSDLQNIAEAIGTYRAKFGNDVTTGCGDTGIGNGWFNKQTPPYKSILACLTEKGYLTTNFIDPFNCTTTTDGAPCSRQGYAYMKYTSGSGDTSITCVYARLEAGSTSDFTASNPCFSASSGTAASFGMNYYVLVK